MFANLPETYGTSGSGKHQSLSAEGTHPPASPSKHPQDAEVSGRGRVGRMGGEELGEILMTPSLPISMVMSGQRQSQVDNRPETTASPAGRYCRCRNSRGGSAETELGQPAVSFRYYPSCTFVRRSECNSQCFFVCFFLLLSAGNQFCLFLFSFSFKFCPSVPSCFVSRLFCFSSVFFSKEKKRKKKKKKKKRRRRRRKERPNEGRKRSGARHEQ